MLSSIPNLVAVETELPKPAQNSSKDARPVADNKEGKAEDKTGTDIYSSYKEDLYLKYTNRDGDVYEVHSSYSEETFLHKEAKMLTDTYEKSRAQKITAKGTDTKQGDGTESVDDKNATMDGVRVWVDKMKEELKQQQAILVKAIMKDQGRTVDSGDGKFFVLYASLAVNSKEGDDSEETSSVPEYWNAENTSDRIVRMATGFAKISGLDPGEFAKIIRSAIEDGFSGAHDVTGDLPGEAGKLNKKTHELVFEKLDKWLEDWEATAYNQSDKPNEQMAQSNEIKERK
jgi:hypothetical protein